MSKYRYSWTKDYGINAQIVGETIERLKEKTAAAVVAAARAADSPLHSIFDWDDSTAAQQYRLIQARTMLSSLRVEIITPEQNVHRVSAFIASSDRGRFVPTLEATDDELSDAEARCLAQMRTFKERWKSLGVARNVVAAIEEVERSAARRKAKRRRA